MADILLIDDDTNIHQIVSLFLADAGHRVHSALTGVAGLALAEQTRPNLILLDIAMPGMDGVAILRALRATQLIADIPVMILTVHDREDINLDLSDQLTVGYLRKPVDMHTLQDKVNEMLSSAPLDHEVSPAYPRVQP